MLTARIVKNHLIAFEPEKVLPALIPDVRALYTNRFFVRLAPCTDFVIGYIAQLIIEATEKGVRFRKYECLRNIRQIIRGHTNRSDLSPSTVELLFVLYQYYIYSEKEEIQWCVSTFLKDRILLPSHISWLIANVTTSTHLLNRLVRYPKLDPQIIEWARIGLEANTFPDRRAELLGILIYENLPNLSTNIPREAILWGIYYSHVSLETKSRLLQSAVTKECADDALNIAMRLRLPEVVNEVARVLED